MRLTVVQINDVHAYLDLHQELFWERGREVYRRAGGYARIATMLREIREEAGGEILVADNGDTLHGTYPAVATQGAALVPILNRLGLSAMTAHWDFAYGPRTLMERAGELRYPLLAANVHDAAGGEQPFLSHSVAEVAGSRIGIVGLASNMVDKTMPPSYSEGLRFSLGEEELRAAVDRLRGRDRVDLVILLSHLGFPQDMKLVSQVPGIDLCLSGHTHNRLYRPALSGGAVVIQSGSHGSFLGRLDLEVEGGRIVDFRHRLMEVAEEVVPDRDIEDLVRETMAPYQDELAQVVGEAATALNRNSMLESTMDNLLLQSLLEVTGARIAFSNGWRYGAPIIPGPVTLNDLHNIIPTNPPVSTVEMTGGELVEMLEENLERTFAADPFDQMGGYLKRALGIRAFVKIENPRGHRVQKLFVGEEEVETDRLYPVAFVTEQGVPGKYSRDRKNHPERAVDALGLYLRRHSPVRAELRGTFTAV